MQPINEKHNKEFICTLIYNSYIKFSVSVWEPKSPWKEVFSFPLNIFS